MADTKITDLTALTGAGTAAGDVFVLVDVSDTTMAASGTDKKITKTELLNVFEAAGAAATAVAAHEADTTSVHGIANTANLYAAGGTDVAVADGGTGSSTAAGARTNLGLIIGTDVQAQDAELSALAGLTSAADKGIQFTGSGTAATYDLTAAGKALLDDADATTQRATLGLVIGTNVQAYDADLLAIAGLTSAADKGIQFTGSGTAATYDLTTAGKALLDDANAGAQRTTLGLGNLATATTLTEYICVAISDETTAITTGTAKITFRMPFAMTVTSVKASLATTSSSGIPTFDINEGGTTILSTKLTIDAGELTSTTAAVAAVISDSALADDAEITIDIDVAGTGAKGAKVWIIGTRVV